MALQPWIANPPVTFTGATTFTPPAWPVATPPVKLSSPGGYAITTPTRSPGAGDLHEWRQTVPAEKGGPMKTGQYRGRRVPSSQPSALRLTKRTIVP
jgi:hypothetical protein